MVSLSSSSRLSSHRCCRCLLYRLISVSLLLPVPRVGELEMNDERMYSKYKNGRRDNLETKYISSQSTYIRQQWAEMSDTHTHTHTLTSISTHASASEKLTSPSSLYIYFAEFIITIPTRWFFLFFAASRTRLYGLFRHSVCVCARVCVKGIRIQ